MIFPEQLSRAFLFHTLRKKDYVKIIEGLQYSKMQQFLHLTSVNSIKSLKICNYLKQLANVLCQAFNS